MSADLAHLSTMAQHKGACEALLAAARLLRMHGHRDAAELVIERVPELVPEVPALVIPPEVPEVPDALPALPRSWPFPRGA